MNNTRVALLLAALTGLFLAIGYLIGGQTGMVMALLFAIATNGFAYWNSDRMVLSMNGARQVSRADAPEFYDMIARLAERAGLPMPKVFIMDNPQPNAFATGRNPQNAAVAATTGLLQLLQPAEVEGVMAHELAHIKNHDTLLMTITATVAGAIAMLVNFGMLFGGRDRNNGLGLVGSLALMILAPLAATIVQMTISRTREYGADRGGAEISGNPRALASALQRISRQTQHFPNEAAEANPAMAHLFIINPLTGQGLDNLFSSHPATENRVAALEALARQNQQSEPPSRPDHPFKRKGPWG